MEDWTLMYWGSRDILTQATGYDPFAINGHTVLTLRTDLEIPQMEHTTIWGHSIGKEETAVRPEYFQHYKAKVKVGKTTLRNGTEIDTKDISFIEDSQQVPLKTALEMLKSQAIPIESLTKDHLYQPVVLLARISSVFSLENWGKSEEMVSVKDASGNEVVDEVTKKIKMKRKPKKEAIGQPVVQPRLDDPELPIMTFGVRLMPYAEGVKTPNIVSVRFLNKNLGNHYVILHDQVPIFSDAIDMGEGGKEDGIQHLTNTYRNTPVLIVGSFIKKDDRKARDGSPLYYINIEGTFLYDLDMGDIDPSDFVQQVGTNDSVPEIEAKTFSDTATFDDTALTTTPSITEPSTLPQPPQPSSSVPKIPLPKESPTHTPTPEETVAKTALSEPASQSQPAKSNAAILQDAAVEAFGLFQEDLTVENLQTFGNLPSYMIVPGSGGKLKDDFRDLASKIVDNVRKEYLGTRDPGQDERKEVVVTPNDGDIPPEEGMIITDVVYNKCVSCKTDVPSGEELAHWPNCPANPESIHYDAQRFPQTG